MARLEREVGSVYTSFPQPTKEQSRMLFEGYAKEKAGEKDALSSVVTSAAFDETLKDDMARERFGRAVDISDSVETLLFRSYLPLAHQIARRLGGSSGAEDLLGESDMILRSTIQRFEPSKKRPDFEPFAAIVIKRKLIDHLRSTGDYSRSEMDKIKEVDGVIGSFYQEGTEPSQAEIKAALGKSDEYTAKAFDVYFGTKKNISLDQEPEFAKSLNHTLASDEKGPEAVVLESLMPKRIIIKKALEILPEREREILESIHFDGQPYKEIAAKYDITQARVSQLVSSAYKKLRANPDIRAEWTDRDEAIELKPTLQKEALVTQRKPSEGAKDGHLYKVSANDGELSYNDGSGELCINGKVIRLSGKQADVCKILMQNPRERFRSTKLQLLIDPKAFFALQTPNIRGTVFRIHKKVGQNFIQHDHGEGYYVDGEASTNEASAE